MTSALQAADSENASECKKVRIAKHFELDVDADAAHSHVERIWAYFRLRQLADSASEQKNTDEAMALAMKHKFVTPWTSMIVVKHNSESTDDGDAKEPSPTPVMKQQSSRRDMRSQTSPLFNASPLRKLRGGPPKSKRMSASAKPSKRKSKRKSKREPSPKCSLSLGDAEEELKSAPLPTATVSVGTADRILPTKSTKSRVSPQSTISAADKD